MRRYEVVYYSRDEEKARISFETEDVHEDAWDMLYSVICETNPRDSMQTSNKDFADKMSEDFTWDERGFVACCGDVMITARRIG